MSIFRTFLRRALAGNVATKPSAGTASTLSRGWAALEAGQWEEAQRLADAAIDGAPQEDSVEAQAYLLRGLARSNRRDFDGALADYAVVLQIQPDSVPCRVNQSAALHTLGRFEEALKAADMALAQDPEHPVAHNNRGLMLRELGQLDEAESALRRALQCDARYHDARAHLAMVLIEQGRLEEAQCEVATVTAASPTHVHARWDRAMLHLLRGEFAAGWQDYDSRLERPEHYHRPYAYPRWDGTALTAGSLLIVAEQGLGDEILFASCFRDAMERARNCVIECEPRLEDLFARSFPGSRVVGAKNESKPAWVEEQSDVVAQLPAGSLPALFRAGIEDFPAHRGYLKADGARIAAWRERLDRLGGELKVGISWIGGLQKTRRRTRSIPLMSWLPILRAVDAHFVSLQHVDSRAEIAQLAEVHQIAVHDWLGPGVTYDDTAALVCALDLVITVTTAVAHLTGALGRDVWVLVPANPEWRYQISGNTMPWYPSARLFRQSVLGDWSPVIDNVADNLAGYQANLNRMER